MQDTRCCGSGACIVNADGLCWCGQKWDGTKLLKRQAAKNEPDTFASLKTPLKKDNLPD
jgi:hypothetical protein